MLAYYDTLSGLIPCKVLEVSQINPYNEPLCKPVNSNSTVTIEITVNKGAWKKGMVLKVSALYVVPRNKISKRKYGWIIKPYTIGDFITNLHHGN